MENFNKFNQENQTSEWEISRGEFQTFSLEYLNQESLESAQENKAEISKNLAEIREGIDEIFEKSRENGGESEFRKMSVERGRESASVFDGAREARAEAEYWGEYGAGFADFGGRAEFVSRNENRGRTAESLSSEIASVKSQVRNVDFSQKMANFGRAIVGRAA